MTLLVNCCFTAYISRDFGSDYNLIYMFVMQQIRIKVGAVERALEEQEKLVEKEEKDLVDQEVSKKEESMHQIHH